MHDGVVSAAPSRDFSIGGIGCTTRDCIVTAASADVSDFLASMPPAGPVTIGISEEARLANRRFSASTGRRFWTPGGTLPNTLCAVASTRDAHGLPIGSIAWSGPAEYGDSIICDVGLAHMREWNIRVEPMYQPGFVREAYCIVDGDTRDVKHVFIYEQGAVVGYQDRAPCDLLIMTMRDFVQADGRLLEYLTRCRRLALLMADWRQSASEFRARIQQVGNVAFVVGQQRDYVELGLYDPQNRRFDEFLLTVECVGTNAAEPVVWKASNTSIGELFPIEATHAASANVLGAGDGYAGGFLAVRTSGLAPLDAHAIASFHSRQVMLSPMSYVPRSEDLNRVFPAHVKRRSRSVTEGSVAARLHESPGLVVTSCGQTGIDQLATQAAGCLGITSFAIMPEGRRTEWRELGIGDPDRLEATTVLELATPSYRFCTWANVFASDGTMLFDYVASEGSEETRRAAHWLGRPVLEMQGIAFSDVASRVAAWIDRYGIRVVNCAGNRRSLLTDTAVGDASGVLQQALLTATATVARRDCGIRSARSTLIAEETARWPDVCLAVPNTAVMRNLLRAFLLDRELLNAEQAQTFTVGQLSWHVGSGAVKIVFSRARDLPVALRRRWADYAVFGQDVWLEDGETIEPLFPVGVDPCCLVEVVERTRQAVDWPSRVVTYASAWPKLARSLLTEDGVGPTVEIVPVTGCIEAWLRTKAIDAGVDTYQTGKAIEENGLSVLRRFRTVHTWVHRRVDSPQVHPLIIALSRWLHG